MERGGLPADLLQGMAQGTKSQIFIGPFSKAFDKNAAITAFQLEKKGLSPQEIWQQTGTVRGPDGQWRKEISDMASTIKGDKPFQDVIMGAYQKGAADTGNQLYKTTVEDVFMHNRLKDAYPELMAIETQMERKGSKSKGSLGYDPKTGEHTIHVRSNLTPEEARSTMLHELQHGVQETEGFAAGGSPEMMDKLIGQAKDRVFLIKQTDEYKVANKELTKLYDNFFTNKVNVNDAKIAEEELLNKYPILNEFRDAVSTVNNLGDNPNEAYGRLMGEAEAKAYANSQKFKQCGKKTILPI
jgi:hypothetical protein